MERRNTMTPDERYEYHRANADRIAAERDRKAAGWEAAGCGFGLLLLALAGTLWQLGGAW